MFQAINRLQRVLANRLRSIAARKTAANKGQTALILVLVIAFALIIYAVSLNWSRVTQVKTLVTLSSNTTATNMASMMASYGEYVLQTTLGGRPKYCKSTSVLVTILTIIIIVIIIIIMVVFHQYELAPLIYAIMVALIISVVLEIIVLIIQVVIIEPGLTRLWNKMQEGSSMEDQLIEQGIATGLQGVVTDPIRISDHFDMDTDGLWVDRTGRANSPVPDKISRYAYYYTMRLKKLQTKKLLGVDNFLIGLNELVNDNPYNKLGPNPPVPPLAGCTVAEQTAGSVKCQMPDNFGLFDPACLAGSADPSPYCNPCCVPLNDPTTGQPLRPQGCDQVAAVDPSCLTPGDYTTAAYPYQYDPMYEDINNTFFSFREKLGFDDENIAFMRNAQNPNSPPSVQLVDASNAFRKEDTTGYYTAAVQAALGLLPPVVADIRQGVFPFFWNMDNFSFAIFPAPGTPTQKSDAVVKLAADDPSTCTALGCPNKLRAPDNVCALNAWNTESPGTNIVGAPPLDPPLKTKGFWWKPGADRYCANSFPYFNCINRAGSSGGCNYTENPSSVPTCGCTVGNPVEWHDDPQDHIVYTIPELAIWSRSLLGISKDQLYKTLPDWYIQAAHWIAPACTSADNCNASPPGNPDKCLYCNHENVDGIMLIWRKMLGDWVDWLDYWLYREHFNDATAWCLPTPNINTLPEVEQNYIKQARLAATPATDRVGTQIWPPTTPPASILYGALPDILACLDFNKNNAAAFTNCQAGCNAATAAAIVTCQAPCIAPAYPTVATQAACRAACVSASADQCLNLPRSTAGALPANANYDRAQTLQNCLSNPCSTAGGSYCAIASALVGVPANCTGFAPGQVFYNAVKAERNLQFDTSGVCEPIAPAISTAFQDIITLSVNGAMLQGPDFTSRSQYLNNITAQAKNARDVFNRGFTNFNNFLKVCPGDAKLGDCNGDCTNGGPAAQLICERKNYSTSFKRLPNFAIYGWQTKPVAGRYNPLSLGYDRAPTGYWHIVRVEAFAPLRCFGYCGNDLWPWVDSYTKGFLGSTRCYELKGVDINTHIVIARVTRFDESHDRLGALFANGQKIWNVRSNNPFGVFSTTAGLETACSMPRVIQYGGKNSTGTSLATQSLLAGAFLINSVPTGSLGDEYTTACWDRVNQLLTMGVQTTTCAQYYLDTGAKHMTLKFHRCNPTKIQAVINKAATTTTGFYQ